MDGQTGKQIERCKRDLDREEENDGRPTLLWSSLPAGTFAVSYLLLAASGSGSSTSVCARTVLRLRKLFTVRSNTMPPSLRGSSRVIPCFSGCLECFPVQNPIICASCHQAYTFPAFSKFLLRYPPAHLLWEAKSLKAASLYITSVPLV
jgi:hypothetical protein